MVSWAHMSQPPNGISIGSAVFAQLIRVPNTHKRTDHATSVSIGRACAMRAMTSKTHKVGAQITGPLRVKKPAIHGVSKKQYTRVT